MENNYKKISRTLIFQLAWCSLAFGKSSLYTNEKAIPIDFYTSMNKSYAFHESHAKNDHSWLLFKEVYEKNIQKESSPELLIPRIIHMIWLGGNFSKHSKKLLDIWKKKHPDWEIKFWTEKEIAEFTLVNQAQYDKATNYGEKSDIARYEILYRYGGLYIDHDFLCIKSFEPLHYACDFYAGLGHLWVPLIYNGLIGCRPEHPIIKKCITEIGQNIPAKTDDYHFSIQLRTGPYLLTRSTEKFLKEKEESSCLILPISYFYGLPNNIRDQNIDSSTLKTWIHAESFALHLWNASWTHI